MSLIFDLSSFHLFAIAFVIVEAVTDSVIDCVVCIIAYPVYNHLPAVVSRGALPYIGLFLVPPKRVYRYGNERLCMMKYDNINYLIFKVNSQEKQKGLSSRHRRKM